MYKLVELESICEVIPGQSPPSSSYNQMKDGLPFFQGKADFNEKYPSIRYWCNKPKKISTRNDILMSVRAPVGAININNIEACIGRGLAAIRCGKDVDLNFLYHFLKYQQQKIQDLGTGSTFKAITMKTLKSIKIPIAPLETQRRIASILDDAAALRDKTKQLLKEYDLLAQSIFLDMFGDPVVNPKGWKVQKLKELSTKIGSGNTPKGGSKVYVKEGITFFRSQNVWRNNLLMNDIAFIDQATHNNMKKSSLKKGDVLMTKTGRVNTENSSLGRAAMYLGEDDKANLNGHVYLIRLKKEVINEYILFILTTNQYREYIRRVCVGGIDKRQLNKNHLEEFPIIYPPLELQNEFAEKLVLIEQQKELARQELQESEDLFNCLLQKAFKGELVNN
ncbi:restriction endonuclease subunit S [uncultured Aquimarina sp.]|uniref:restriction endonuclease subunit S n=1 Tax=uncultured Aquimarina sp. TaxID=575652 RepID=UPI002613271E|nr:restriction endonuclease subunit S [uncultured Aquimarina sp.]